MAFKLLPEETTTGPNGDFKESLHRVPAQALKSVAAAIPGMFGDVASLADKYIAAPASKAITGKEAAPYEETPLGKILPTTKQHIQNLEQGIPYLKPKNKVEKFIGDVAEDAASLFIPSGSISKIGLRGSSALKSLYTSLGANATEQFVSEFTGDEKKGAQAKMGAMMLLSALNKPAAQKEINALYQKKDQLLPSNASTGSSKIYSDTNRLKTDILQGRSYQDLAPSEKFVVDETDKILRNTHGGQIEIKTLEALKRSLNENLQKFVYEAADKGSKVRARAKAAQINGFIKNTMKDYGTTNPEWWKLQKNADQAYGAIQQSNLISRFIQNHVKGNAALSPLLHFLGVSGGAATGAILPYQAAKIGYRIMKSPELAKHYSRIIGSASAENAVIMNREIKILEDKIKKEESEKENRFRLLD